MWGPSRVIVVVPAWEEAPRIERVVRSVPGWVDAIVVVDDASTDSTSSRARAVGDPRVAIVRHSRNRGVGAAIASGYRYALSLSGAPHDAFVVMAGDGQMDPGDLPGLLEPISQDEADYVKGNRFASRTTSRSMPAVRLLGGLALSWATAQATGLALSDAQCGYTAISRAACERLDLDALWPRYGYPNDILSQLALRGLRVRQAPVRAVYGNEVSRLKARHLPAIAWIIARASLRRLRQAL
jgi:glycosyltransferase involved in cell wall biosynthesis